MSVKSDSTSDVTAKLGDDAEILGSPVAAAAAACGGVAVAAGFGACSAQSA